MLQRLAPALLCFGLALCTPKFALGGMLVVPGECAPFLWGAGILFLGLWLHHAVLVGIAEIRAWRAHRRTSPQAAALTPHLFGNYSPYVIEAAETLGAARDISAVPALLRALENTVIERRPSWQTVAEALIHALAQIGDGRALPVLCRLEDMPEVGSLPSIRSAIYTIEPKSSLLRPGSADPAPAGVLLRPAQDQAGEPLPSILVRAADPHGS